MGNGPDRPGEEEGMNKEWQKEYRKLTGEEREELSKLICSGYVEPDEENRCDIVDLTLQDGTRVRGSYEWDSEDWIELEVWNE